MTPLTETTEFLQAQDAANLNCTDPKLVWMSQEESFFFGVAKGTEIGRIATDALERLANTPKLWECLKCGFEMHEQHYREAKPGEDYEPCPCCGETQLRERLEMIAKLCRDSVYVAPECRDSIFLQISELSETT